MFNIQHHLNICFNFYMENQKKACIYLKKVAELTSLADTLYGGAILILPPEMAL